MQFRNKEDNLKYQRPTAKLALACLLFLVAALGPTPALAGRRVEALPHSISVSEKAVAAGPTSPEEMEAFLDDFFETKITKSGWRNWRPMPPLASTSTTAPAKLACGKPLS